jgi:putative RecB family exonuclease
MLYSHSRLSTFEQCPYKYKLRYLDNIDPIIPDTIETFLGSIVHQTLEKLYNDLQYCHKNTLEEILDYLYHLWYDNWNDDILIVKQQYDMQNYLSLATKYLTEYYKTYEPFDETRTIATEERIIIDLDEDKHYKLQGYIDRIAEKEPGYYEIHDYKTNSRLPSQKQLDADRQLALYAFGLKNQYPDVRDITLIWHYLKFNKEMHSKRSADQLEKLKSEVISLIETIEKTTNFSRKPSALCHWCEYKPICPQYSHLYQIREHRENIYMSQTGKQLVDRYAELKKQTKQMKLDLYAELEHLKEALIQYGNREQIDVLYGTEAKININQKTHFPLPKKGSKQRKELKKVLQSNGKWKEVDCLDTNALNYAIQHKKWDEDVLDQLKPFIKSETKKQISFSKQKQK